jgi:hypothetical protein
MCCALMAGEFVVTSASTHRSFFREKADARTNKITSGLAEARWNEVLNDSAHQL